MKNEEILTTQNAADTANAAPIDAEEEAAKTLAQFTTGNNYENSSDKYKDNLSSAITFLVCGLAGLVVLLLNDLGVLHFIARGSSSFILMNIVLGGVFIAFIIIGALSFKIARNAKENIANEKHMTDEIFTWLRENVTAEQVDASYDSADLAEEMKYFSRSAYIKAAVQSEFDTVSDEIAGVITDQYIDELFAR